MAKQKRENRKKPQIAKFGEFDLGEGRDDVAVLGPWQRYGKL